MSDSTTGRQSNRGSRAPTRTCRSVEACRCLTTSDQTPKPKFPVSSFQFPLLSILSSCLQPKFPISSFQYQVSSPVIPSYNGDAIESPLVRVESDGGKRLPPRSCSPGTARLPPRTRGGAEAPRPQAMHACLRSPRGSRGFRLASREPVETDVTVTGDFRTNAIAASTMSLAPQQFAIWPALLRSGVLGEPALPRKLPVWL